MTDQFNSTSIIGRKVGGIGLSMSTVFLTNILKYRLDMLAMETIKSSIQSSSRKLESRWI